MLSDSDNIVICQSLNKKYETIEALKDVSFEVQKGEIFGLIGPDGAGKTSLFRILTTLLLPDSGTASVMGLDVVKDYKEIRKNVGYMPGRFSLYQDLSVEENLNLFARVFNTSIQENYHLIEDIYTQIEPFKKRRAGKLSGGMKQKLALCCALIHKPEILFLDEPTTGVDPVSRKEFWGMLKKLQCQGLTVIVSTPYMDEAKLCDRIAFIHKGEILKIDTPDGLIKSFSKKLFFVEPQDSYNALLTLRKEENVDSVFAFGDRLHVTLKDETKKINFCDLQEIEPGIEDCFIQLIR